MRKRISSRKFGKLSAHRKAMMSNLASSLIEHKQIKTTHQKALELRKFIEPMILANSSPLEFKSILVGTPLKEKVFARVDGLSK